MRQETQPVRHVNNRRSKMLLLAVALGTFAMFATGAVWSQEAASSPEQTTQLPSPMEIQGDVTEFFNSLTPRPTASDIISRDQVEEMLKEPKFAWIADQQRQEILDRVLPPGDYLVQQLRTDRGREFAAKIASTPGAFDRIDRLRTAGTRDTTKIIQSRDGYKWILYLAGDRKGKIQSQWMQDTGIPGSEDFAKPTGRIYTQALLVTALQDALKSDQEPPAQTVIWQ